MLILTRRPGEAITIDLMGDIDPNTPVGELFAFGPIEIRVMDVRVNQAKLGIEADSRLRILREELREEAAIRGDAVRG